MREREGALSRRLATALPQLGTTGWTVLLDLTAERVWHFGHLEPAERVPSGLRLWLSCARLHLPVDTIHLFARHAPLHLNVPVRLPKAHAHVL